MTNNEEKASITPNFDASTDWILLGVQRGGDALVLDADEGFRQHELLPELWACDNMIDLPSSLKPGLYRLTDIVIKPDSYGDPTFKGVLTALHIHAPAHTQPESH